MKVDLILKNLRLTLDKNEKISRESKIDVEDQCMDNLLLKIKIIFNKRIITLINRYLRENL